MSAGTQISDEDKKFAKEFAQDIETFLKPLCEKYKGRVADFVVLVNWEQELRQKPYPKMIIETLRDVQSSGFDPIRQALETSSLMNMGCMQTLQQALFRTVQDLNGVVQQLQARRRCLQGTPRLSFPARAEFFVLIIVPGLLREPRFLLEIAWQRKR